jgi:hypothetical protein
MHYGAAAALERKNKEKEERSHRNARTRDGNA